MKWVEGRQGTGYKVLTLFKSSLLKADGYIIKYEVGSYIPSHKDLAPNGFTHERINIVYKSSDCVRGDYYESLNSSKPFLKIGPIEIFRISPSEVLHSVSELKQGKRYVLSFGWLKKKDERKTT